MRLYRPARHRETLKTAGCGNRLYGECYYTKLRGRSLLLHHLATTHYLYPQLVGSGDNLLDGYRERIVIREGTAFLFYLKFGRGGTVNTLLSASCGSVA